MAIFMFLLLCLSTGTYSVFGQRTISRDYIKESKKRTVHPYDSTYNITGKNVQNLVGQSLYFMPSSYSETKGDYGVILIYMEDGKDESPLLTKENMYFPTDGEFQPVTSYDALQGKTFPIVGYIPEESLSSEPELILINQENGRRMCMHLQGITRYEYMPIVVSGYYEKIKNKEINKFYYLKDRSYIFRLNDHDQVSTIPGDILECVDVAIEDHGNKNALLILQDQEGTEYFIQDWRKSMMLFHIDMDGKALESFVITPSTPKRIKEKMLFEKYGENVANDILRGHVEIGYDTDMCRAAWGWPEDINKTKLKNKTLEQWVYERGYLYFQNGILTSIQE